MSVKYRNTLEEISRISRKNIFLKKVVRNLNEFEMWSKIFQADEVFARRMYKKYTGDNLNLKDPKTYNEKLWWLKYHYRNPLQKICSDKYRVREYVKECGLKHILVELYGIYDNPKEIDFSEFEQEVFLKINVGSGGNIIYDPQKKW